MRSEPALGPNNSVKRQSRSIDRAIAALAARQCGVVASAQLRELGLNRQAIAYRLRVGRLHLVHRGVYAVGHRLLSREGKWMAAVLAAGPDAVLSHRSAAALWGLRQSAGGRVEVITARARRSREGIRLHQAVLPADEVTVEHGIPVTTPSRTLLDLAAVVAPRQLERAFREAEYLRLADALAIDDLLARNPGRRGTAAVREILAERAIGLTVTRSELEERFLAFVDDFDLPRPLVNALVETPDGGQVEADCVWRRERVIVELDGHASHATATGFERDRARDRRLQAAGWRVMRVTWRQLHDDPVALLRDLTTVLASARVTA